MGGFVALLALLQLGLFVLIAWPVMLVFPLVTAGAFTISFGQAVAAMFIAWLVSLVMASGSSN